MRTTITRLTRTAAIGTAALGMVFTGMAVANADEWPPMPSEPSPIVPYETKSFLTPSDPEYWNPLVAEDRLTSPFGTRTLIVCTGFHGVTLECWQADQNCQPHKLIKLPWNFPAIVGGNLPGGGPGHFVYPVGTATPVGGPVTPVVPPAGVTPVVPPASGVGTNDPCYPY